MLLAILQSIWKERLEDAEAMQQLLNSKPCLVHKEEVATILPGETHDYPEQVCQSL